MSAENKLHVISLDIPYPADYGGVIDIFFKLKALHAVGLKIHLHCFHHSRLPQKKLEELVSSVDYYQRIRSIGRLLGSKPYIVSSRESDRLREILLQDDAPVLMEGLHSTALLADPAFSRRKFIVRTHNVEHDYYEGLAKAESRMLRRWYLNAESRRLRRYEGILENATAIAAISPEDTDYFNSRYANAFYLPAFHPFEKVDIKVEAGDYALYHGNLAVGENNQAALFLVNQVFSKLPYQLVIAGSRPSDELRSAVSRFDNIKLIDDLTPEKIHERISLARVNVLPTFQSTGIKLKLLAALFLGKKCIVNGHMVRNTGLETLCTVADDAEGFRTAIEDEFSLNSWDDAALRERKLVLEAMFSNSANAKNLVNRIFR